MASRQTASSPIHQRLRHAAPRLCFGMSFVLASCMNVITMTLLLKNNPDLKKRVTLAGS
jgi:hypothetical protein